MANTKPKTTPPSGLTITRSGNSFTFKWRLGESDYDQGQKLRYRAMVGGAWSDWITLTKNTTPRITNKQTEFSTTFDLTILQAVSFQVCGNRKKKGKEKEDPGWSTWSGKRWDATIPTINVPSYENSSTNSGTFSWSAASDNTGTAILTRVEAQTCYVRSAAEPSIYQWGALMTKAASGSEAITEDSEVIAAGNIVRWYRVRAVGPAGASEWRSVYHAYGIPTQALVGSCSVEFKGATAQITASWKDNYDRLKPIDKIMVQYVIDTPLANMAPPSSGWQNAIEVAPNGSYNKVVVNVEASIDVDQCVWIRVRSDHDGNYAYSTNSPIAYVGKLATPTLNATVNALTGVVKIDITEETSCTIADTAIFFRSETDPSNDRMVAILPRGTTTTTIVVGDVIGSSTTCFGAFAFIGPYSGLSIIRTWMTSDVVLDTDISAVPPSFVGLEEGSREGSVRISWDWTWTEATHAELSWADYSDAWESTDQPSKYVVEDRYALSWLIAGLETGKRWYFRVRLIKEADEKIIGPWSDVYFYDLTSTPDRPALTLSKSVINEGEGVTARWAFTAAGNDSQAYAEICLVTFDENGDPQYGDVIVHTDYGQSAVIEREWVTGNTYYMAVRVTTVSGVQSVWSEPVSLFVTDPVQIAISQHSLTTTVVNNETVYTLDVMPLTVTVTGAGISGETTVTIVRAEDYHIFRPDEKDYDGYEGETIATRSQTGESQMTIAVRDLVGSLDDNARYNLIATVKDAYGQSASISLMFTVDWLHKAGIPDVTVTTDTTHRATIITPIAPEEYAQGDTCDIYRLTIDMPELIFKGASFGVSYVDPYPGFGEACGHRLVMRTSNGDYATADGIGWYDTGSDDGDLIEENQMVITIGGAQIELPYNLSLNNKWNKDFKRTQYLGGSVQGDWNPIVTRDLTAETVLVRSDDLDRQIAMHDLAGYTGVAHVRTPDGSSLTANIQISETQRFDTKRVSYTVTIQAIDSQEPVGMTLEEWTASQPDEVTP